MISGEVLKYLKGEHVVIHQKQGSTAKPSSLSDNAYLEAFANLYVGFAEAIQARRDGREPTAVGQNIPNAYDGLKGVAFVDAVVDSAESASPVWLKPVAV